MAELQIVLYTLKKGGNYNLKQLLPEISKDDLRQVQIISQPYVEVGKYRYSFDLYKLRARVLISPDSILKLVDSAYSWTLTFDLTEQEFEGLSEKLQRPLPLATSLCGKKRISIKKKGNQNQIDQTELLEDFIQTVEIYAGGQEQLSNS